VDDFVVYGHGCSYLGVVLSEVRAFTVFFSLAQPPPRSFPFFVMCPARSDFEATLGVIREGAYIRKMVRRNWGLRVMDTSHA
jgi:hypothetical protein